LNASPERREDERADLFEFGRVDLVAEEAEDDNVRSDGAKEDLQDLGVVGNVDARRARRAQVVTTGCASGSAAERSATRAAADVLASI
jgi:hypothetical protein